MALTNVGRNPTLLTSQYAKRKTRCFSECSLQQERCLHSIKKELEMVCADFLSTRLLDVVRADVDVQSQSLLQLGGSVEKGDVFYSNMVLVQVTVQKSAYSRTYLNSKDLANAITGDSSLLLVMLKSKEQGYFETLSQIIPTSTTEGETEEDLPEDEKPPVRGPVDPEACNGLKNLCDIRVNDAMFATMHNANSDSGTATLDANHKHDILAALKAGVRGLNVDMGKCNVKGVKKLSLVHSSCYLGFSDPFKVFTEIHQFLTDNPREVIVMPVQVNDNTGGRVRLTEIDLLLYQVVDDKGKKMKDRLYKHPHFDPNFPQRNEWPTLSELIEKDQRIIFAHYDALETCAEQGCPPGFNDWFLIASESKFGFQTVEDITKDPEGSCMITRGEHSLRDWFGINVFLDLPLEASSAKMNQADFLRERIETCKRVNNNMQPNLVAVDFWNTGDILQVVDEYNSQLLPKTPSPSS